MVVMRRRRTQRDEECSEERNAVRTRSIGMQDDSRDQNQACRGNEQGRCLRSMGSPLIGSPPNERARPRTRKARRGLQNSLIASQAPASRTLSNADAALDRFFGSTEEGEMSQDDTISPADEGVGVLRRSERIDVAVGDAPERTPALFDEEASDDKTLERNLDGCHQSPEPLNERDRHYEESGSEGMDGAGGSEEEEDLRHNNHVSKKRKIAALTPVKENVLAELTTPERYIVQFGKVPVEIPAVKPLLQLAAGISECAARVAMQAERHFEFRTVPKNFRKATVPVWDRPHRAWQSSCLQIKCLDTRRALDVIEREMHTLMVCKRQLQERVQAGREDSSVGKACDILSLVPMVQL